MMLAVWWAALAMADIAPPPGYVESCTVARVQKDNPGQSCVSCDAWHGGREDCETHEAQGYVKRCKTRGASTWDEVLCKAGPAAVVEEAPADPEPASAPEAAPEAESSPGLNSVSCHTASSWPLQGWAGLVLLSLALVRRGSRRG